VSRLYVDTSAYLCLLLGERGSARLEREFSGSQLASSVLLVLETNRNLIRLLRAGLLSESECHSCQARLEEDMDQFVLRDLTLDLCGYGIVPAISTPRSLDLGHLRTALWFHRHEPLDRFVTLDLALEESAREVGLPV
jgi:hypothetical protein